MLRTLFKIGPIGIHTYGLMLAIAFFAGLWYLKRRSPAERLPFDKILNVAYILIFCGVIGARLGYVVLHLSDFAEDPWSAINPFHGGNFGIAGLNLYGGVLLALVVVWIYLWLKKLPWLAVFDMLAPTVGLGIGIGRIGCFLNGCCFGTPTNLPWGITFPKGSIPDSVFPQQAIHPAQLYSSLYGFLLFIGLHYILKRKRFDGQVIAIYLMVEAVFRFSIEYVRYYESAMHFSFLGLEPTWNQVASLLLFAMGLIVYFSVPRTLYRESEAARG
jgi:phosphatidylglycerol:prolipoprotein diacylglycerol transferase